MILEFVFLASLAIAGAMICPFGRDHPGYGWGAPAVAFIIGLSLYIVVSALQVITGLPTNPRLTLAVVLIIALSVRFYGSGKIVPLHVISGLGASLALAAVIYVARTIRLDRHTFDSYRYAELAALLANDRIEFVAGNLLINRQLAVPSLHAPALLQGENYLAGLGPALAVALLWLLAWLIHSSLMPRIGGARAMLLALSAVAALITNHFFVFNIAYINGHLLTGVLVLMLAGVPLQRRLLTTRPDTPLHIDLAMFVVVMPFGVLRPEAPLLALLVLAPILVSRRYEIRSRQLLLGLLGLSTMLWYAFISFHLAVREGAGWGNLDWTVAGMAALGLLLTASSIGLAWIDRPRMPEIWKLSLAEGGLWTAVGAYLLTDSGILMRSVRSTAENVLTHIGGWGSFLLLFGVGGLLALILLRREALLAIRFPLTGFIPLVILLAYLREGAYRVGPGDSLNRMWIHVLPLAILFVAISAANRPRLRGLGRVAAASGAPTKEQTSTHLRR